MVSELLARRDRTLGDSRDTILPRPVLLQNAVPVKSGALCRLGDIVVKSDLDSVSPVGFDQRTGELAVDEEDITLVAIRSDDTSANGKVIGADDTYASQ